MHVQKYVHDMAAWDSLSVTEQEHVIGRTKLEDLELDDDEKPADAHIALNVITDDDGTELKIVRHNMPFGELGKGEFGTYFIGYSRTPQVTEQMLRNMFLGDPPGNTDRILDFSTAVTGGLFFSPTVDFLDDPPPLPSSPAAAPAVITVPRRWLAGDRQFERNPAMNNLYRDLAPVTEEAWEEIELEATRTFKRHIAGRRVVDVSEPGGPVDGGGQHRATARRQSALRRRGQHTCAPANRLCGFGFRSRCRVRRSTTWNVARRTPTGIRSRPPPRSWRSSKTARSSRATAPHRSRASAAASSQPAADLPEDPRAIPDVITQALSELRLAGVDGPYSVLLSADVYTKVSETTEHGYPILEHINRLVNGDIIWAPAIDGAFVLTTRGGDFDLQLGTDVSIGYLSHDADTVQLYLQETLTFLCYTAEASVALSL